MAKHLKTEHKTKHQNRASQEEEEEEAALIPGLPDHLAQIPLSLLPPSLLYSINHSWRRFLYSQSFPPFPSLYTLLSSPSSSSLEISCFDPISSTWVPLPPPPSKAILLRHSAFIARDLPIQSVSVSNHLVLLAASTHNLLPALPRPLLFNPIDRKWVFGPPVNTPRRWCAAASVGGALFLASGVGSKYNPDVACSAEKWVLKSGFKPEPERVPKSNLRPAVGSEIEAIGAGLDYNHSTIRSKTLKMSPGRRSGSGNGYPPDSVHSAEKWVLELATGFGAPGKTKSRHNPNSRHTDGIRVPKTGTGSGWERLAPMKNGRFSREAVEGVGWRGRVCMVNSLKEGVIYNVEEDEWEEMPEGMLAGWNGPAAAMNEDEIYVVDEVYGVLSRYVPERDAWEEVVEHRMMIGAVKMAAGGGRVCVVCGGDGDGSRVLVVNVVAQPTRLWVVQPPGKCKVLAVHVLPRMGANIPALTY